MPYNNAPIPPQEEVTGTSLLPLARVKKIIAQDEDIAQCSNSAAFVISVATEMFIRELTQQAHTVVKSERKPRRNIQYKDFAAAVARIENLEFLSDVIPKTTTYKQFKEKKAREAAGGAAVEAGQTTLSAKTPTALGNGTNGNPERDLAMDEGQDAEEEDYVLGIHKMLLPGHTTPSTKLSPPRTNGSVVYEAAKEGEQDTDEEDYVLGLSKRLPPDLHGSPIVDRTVQSTASHAHPATDDVNMTG